jgi:hypothetical protein
VVSDVVLDDGARDNGLALMIAQMVEENLAAHPYKRDDLKALGPLAVGIVATDAATRLTLVFEGGRLTVYDGLHPACDVRVHAPAEGVVRLAQLPVARIGPLRVPQALGGVGRRLIGDLCRGRVRVRRMWAHPLKLARLMRLLSVNG